MKLRSLVPIFGVLAAPLIAAESVVTVADGTKLKLSGWVDTIFSASDTTDDKVQVANLDTGFYAKASLKAEVTYDKVRVYTNLWISPDVSALQAREAYITLTLPNDVTLTTGKYIDHLGWISAEPTGLYTVNASVIGYTGAYGNDVVGAKLNWTSKKVDLEVDVTNGYFTAADAYSRSSGTTSGRTRSGLGYGADITVRPVDGFSLDGEWAYDQSSAAPTYANKGGDVWQVGVNGTITGKDTKIDVLKPVIIAAEYIHRRALESTTVAGASSAKNKDGAEWNQGLFLINYALPAEKLPFPIALTLLAEYINQATETAGETSTNRVSEVGFAVMTNPFKVSNLGVNFEIDWSQGKFTPGGGGAETKSKGPTVSFEVFSSF